VASKALCVTFEACEVNIDNRNLMLHGKDQSSRRISIKILTLRDASRACIVVFCCHGIILLIVDDDEGWHRNRVVAFKIEILFPLKQRLGK